MCRVFIFWAPDLFCCKFMKNTMKTMKIHEDIRKYMKIHENPWKYMKIQVLIQNTIQKQYKIHVIIKIYENTWKYNTKYKKMHVFSTLSYISPWGAQRIKTLHFSELWSTRPSAARRRHARASRQGGASRSRARPLAGRRTRRTRSCRATWAF